MEHSKGAKNKVLLTENATIFPKTNNISVPNATSIFLHKSVTFLAYQDKAGANSTSSSDSAQSKLLFGIVAEDIPLFVGALIGASFVIAVCLIIVILWKCCTTMTILGKKKEYWLYPSNSIKGKCKIPVVSSSSVVFLGLRSAQSHDCRGSLEDCQALAKEEDPLQTTSFCNPLHNHIMSEQYTEIDIPESEQRTCSDTDPRVSCPTKDTTANNCSVVPVNSGMEIGTRTSQESHGPHSIVSSISSPGRRNDSPFRRSFYSGTFDQRSLNSDSPWGSDAALKKASSFTWGNYNLRRPSDAYYDIFQKASYCKKRKNRMRSDIAAAIALNRSVSTRVDTERLVGGEVEVVFNERTPL